jgi:hypothetical protein
MLVPTEGTNISWLQIYEAMVLPANLYNIHLNLQKKNYYDFARLSTTLLECSCHQTLEINERRKEMVLADLINNILIWPLMELLLF